MTQAVAYLRKSKVTSDRHLSWEVQETQIRELGTRHGDTELVLLSDWGKSGRGEKTRLRTGYGQLKAMIAAGQVRVVYSYSLSRLARSLGEYAALAELCRDHGVTIRLCKEGEHDYSNASGRMVVGVIALFAQMEAELAQERARDTVALRRGRGDHIGQPPYGFRLVEGALVEDPAEPIEPVLDAYRAEGSYHGAARRLNADGFDSRRGAPWSDMTVRRIIARAAPDDLKRAVRATKRGAKGRGDQLLFQLLRCHCGTTMTPTSDLVRGYGPYVSYTCWRARHDSSHPRPHKIAETRLVEWVQAEAGRLRAPEAYQAADDAAARRQSLMERRGRVADNYEDGMIERAVRDDKVRAIDDELERLESAGVMVQIPAIDWTTPPAKLNEVLRTMWAHVQLNEQLLPVEAEWIVPEWRA